MKVRAKYQGISRPVEVESGQCTLSDLHHKTAEIFLLDCGSFSLSLNKSDKLKGDDQTLEQLGIVPGDLIFVLTPEPVDRKASRSVHNNVNGTQRPSGNGNVNNNANGTKTMQADSTASSSCADEPVNVLSATSCGDVGANDTDMHCDGENRNPEEFQQASAVPSAEVAGSSIGDTSTLQDGFDTGVERDVTVSSPIEDPEVNRCLLEPLLCRESTPTSVPAMLRDLYSGASCISDTDALWIVVHALMMEVGFRPVENIGLSMADDWNRHGFYKQEYQHLFVTAPHSCSIVGVPMAPMLIVHGTAVGDPPMKTDSQKLKVSEFVQGPIAEKDICQVYLNLEKLSRTVKDLICQPLLSHLSDVCGFPVSLGLTSLSYELKLKLLSYLSANCLVRMGQVCREYSIVCKDRYLWRRLYLRDFGRNGDNSLNKDWYRLYREEHYRWKERRRAARHRPMLTGIPPWLNPPPAHLWPPPPLAGGIIGGDYDLNPEFASNIPHPLLGRRPPGPTLPFGVGPGGPFGVGPGGPFGPRPRYDDPFGPGALPFGPPGGPFGPPNGPFGPMGGPFGPNGPGGVGPPGAHYTSLGGGSPRQNRPSPFGSFGGRKF